MWLYDILFRPAVWQGMKLMDWDTYQYPGVLVPPSHFYINQIVLSYSCLVYQVCWSSTFNPQDLIASCINDYMRE